MRIHVLFALPLAALLLAGCVAVAPTITVNDPWVRAAVTTSAEPAPSGTPMAGMKPGGATMDGSQASGGGNSAAYMRLSNPGREADRLIAATSDVATTVEVHETQIEDGVMRMRPVVGGLTIPAGGEVELKPGSYHIMLMGLKRGLEAGETITLTLTFERAGAVQVTAPVRIPQ